MRAPLARWLLRIAPRTASPGAVVAAALLLGFSLVVRLPMDAMLETPLPPYITVYPLLPVIGFMAGLRVGIGTTFVAMLFAWYLWIEPYGSFAIPDYRTAFAIAIFVIAGPVAVGFGALARHALAQVADHQAVSDRNAREAVHRTKNLLASVSAVVRGEAKRATDVRALASSIEGTLSAMSRAQDVLIKAEGAPASLSKLVEAGLATCSSNPRLHVKQGPEVELRQGDFSGLVLALHELGTNSYKYGALSGEAGKVEVTWTDGEICRLTWIETGIEVKSPDDGFGSRLIRGALSKIDGGAVTYERLANEVRCAFVWRPRD